MSNQGAVIAIGAIGAGGLLLWSRRSALPADPIGSAADALAAAIAQLDAATARAAGIGSTPPSPQGQTSTGATTAPAPKPTGQVLVDAVLPFLDGTTNKVNPATGAIVKAAPTEQTTGPDGTALPPGWTYDTATGLYRGPVRF